MASPLAQQASTPANSRRKASAVLPSTPPRRPMPVWNAKLDALSHCCEGELAEDQRKSWSKGGAETLLAKNQYEATKQKRISEVKKSVATSRDKVMANLRLLGEAHQRLTSGSSDVSVQYGKSNLSLEEILPIFEDLSKLLQCKTKAENVQVEELLVQKNDAIQQMEAVRQERDEFLQERDLYLEQKHAIRQERDEIRQERDALMQERDALMQDKDCYHEEAKTLKQEQQLREEAAKKSAQKVLEKARKERDDARISGTRYRRERDKARDGRDTIRTEMDQLTKERSLEEAEMLRKERQLREEACEISAMLENVEKERDGLCVLKDRYRQERDSAREEYESIRTKHRQYWAQVVKMKEGLQEEVVQSSSSTTSNKTLDEDFAQLKIIISRARQAANNKIRTIEKSLQSTARQVTKSRNELANYKIESESEKRRQGIELQGMQNVKLHSQRSELESNHSVMVDKLTRNWEQEKTQLVASAATDREQLERDYDNKVRDLMQNWEQEKTQLVASAATNQEKLKTKHANTICDLTQSWAQEKANLTASAAAAQDAVLAVRKELDSCSLDLETHLTWLRRSRKAVTRNQDVINEVIVTIFSLRSSYHDMRSSYSHLRSSRNNLCNALVEKSRTVNAHINQIQGLEEQRTQLQEAIARLGSESDYFQRRLCIKEEELDKSFTANEASDLALDEIRCIHAACEHDKRLQLGHINRHTFFEDFSRLAKSPPEDSMVFEGQENGRDVDVCFRVLPENNEALCLIRRKDGVFIVCYSKLEDCSTFSHDWQR